MQRAIVVGAGVVGLSCAVRLAEAGYRVDVLARDLPLETTSAVAAALWYPYRALPQDKVTAWARTSYDEFARLAQLEGSGVRMLPGTEVLAAPTEDPWWASAVPDLQRTVPTGSYPDAWSFVAPVVDMTVYLPWLTARLVELGGTLTRLNLSRLPRPEDQPEDPDTVVVNCSAIGSRLLAADPSVVPVRGQVVLVEQFGLDRWWLHSEGPTYVVPRERVVVVGGTAEQGEWSRTPSPETATAILQRASELVPQLGHARVLQHRVGLRPTRPSVRLEADGRTVHCYGQGGAGVTISWGCADDVVTLAQWSRSSTSPDRARP